MEQKIKEVQEYFISKILNSQFIITHKEEYTWNLTIDEKYVFEIWMQNAPVYRKPKPVHGVNFMDLGFTDKQAIELDKILKPLYKEWVNDILIEKKRKELKELENI